MTTPTREQLSVWLETAQAQRVEMQVLLEHAHEAQAQFAADNQRLREGGCCHIHDPNAVADAIAAAASEDDEHGA